MNKPLIFIPLYFLGVLILFGSLFFPPSLHSDSDDAACQHYGFDKMSSSRTGICLKLIFNNHTATYDKEYYPLSLLEEPIDTTCVTPNEVILYHNDSTWTSIALRRCPSYVLVHKEGEP